PAARHPALEGKVPLLILGVLALRVVRAETEAEIRQRVPSRWQRQPVGVGVFQRVVPGVTSVAGPLDAGAGTERRAHLTLDRVPAQRVENAVTGSNRRLFPGGRSRPQAR